MTRDWRTAFRILTVRQLRAVVASAERRGRLDMVAAAKAVLRERGRR